MADRKFYGQKRTYTLANEIGKGGEGQVYELSDDPNLVLKLYTEPLTAAKIRKLKQMVAKGNDKIMNYAAWPQDIVSDSKGTVCGFVMKKLTNYVPIHMLFSPMDRKKMFPDKGYNFLVRVAGNLSRAFHACHSGDLVMGDVNEGNILVNNMGMVAFIDCDSFQIKDGNEYHYCEVGVPRYTPPELLAKSSFENVIRTVNTDIFSMSILIFQLLFLGRHPFAGKNISKEEIDEEKAIKQKWFAYSLINKSNRLSPPNNSYSMKYISAELSTLFHHSFESIENRPATPLWIKELDAYEKQLVPCSKSKVHIYPSKLSVCIWCEFKEKGNILFFLDDSYLEQIHSLNDIERFVNGFKVEPLRQATIAFPQFPVKPIIPTAIDERLAQKRNHQIYIVFGLVIASALLAFVSLWFLLAGFIIFLIVAIRIPWVKQYTTEQKKRESEVVLWKQKLELAIKEHNDRSEYLGYQKSASQLERLVLQYKDLPNELARKRKAMEEKLYNSQLHEYLANYKIFEHSIAAIGPTRQSSLLAAGIRNASDIAKLNKIKVQGIGPTFIQKLFSWQRQVGSNFVYQPNNYIIGIETRQLNEEIERSKKQLENEIKKEYQSLQYIKVNIDTRKRNVENQIQGLTERYFQAKADFEVFSNK